MGAFMIRELLIYPAFTIMLLTFSLQLVDSAESVSLKTAEFALDMQNAVDCAVKGIDIYECSPNLKGYDFNEDINKAIKQNQEIKSNLNSILNEEEYDYIIKKENNKIIIEISS
jgi:protein associated with RNAse G/E